MTCKCCGTNWKNDVATSEIREEIKRRKILAQNELDAYWRAVWPMRNLIHWLWVPNFIGALLGANFFAVFMSVRYGAFIYESVWGMLVLTLASGIVFFLILSPMIYGSKKESRLYRAFNNKHPEYAEALSGS